jgi:hypothetical protein
MTYTEQRVLCYMLRTAIHISSTYVKGAAPKGTFYARMFFMGGIGESER